MIEVHEKYLLRIVTWTSRTKGKESKKKGKIIGIAREGTIPIVYAKKHWPGHKPMFEAIRPIRYGEERYYIEIRNGDRKPKLYLPYLKNMEFL